jgi:hypothetical protein
MQRKHTPRYGQADHLVDKFGGLPAVSRLVGQHPITIRKWSYPVAKGGQDGLVPRKALDKLLRGAREEGVYLTEDDLAPRYKGVR